MLAAVSVTYLLLKRDRRMIETNLRRRSILILISSVFFFAGCNYGEAAHFQTCYRDKYVAGFILKCSFFVQTYKTQSENKITTD